MSARDDSDGGRRACRRDAEMVERIRGPAALAVARPARPSQL